MPSISFFNVSDKKFKGFFPGCLEVLADAFALWFIIKSPHPMFTGAVVLQEATGIMLAGVALAGHPPHDIGVTGAELLKHERGGSTHGCVGAGLRRSPCC